MTYATLVDAATLRSRLGDPAWAIFDVRHQLTDVDYGRRAYANGHIPGAVYLHCDDDLSGEKTGRNGRHPLPDPAVLAETLRCRGVSNDTQVVVYDDCQGMMACRLWWMMRWLGHRRVAVLDGGLQAWLGQGGELTAEQPLPSRGSFTPDLQSGLAVEVDFLVANLQQAAICLVDARSPDRFRGENETIDPVGGHIPGARNRFFRDNLMPDGRFKPAEDLRREWSDLLGDCPSVAVVHQCGSGVSACVNSLAMELAGMVGSRLYPGSWSEWCADPGRPMA